MNKVLKPCPFCGESARYDWIEAGCAVKCYSCDVSVMRGGVGVGWYATEAEAAADWNRRAQPAAAEGVEDVQVMARVHHNDEHAEPVRAVLNSIGRQMEDDAKLMAVAQHERIVSAVTAERDRLLQDSKRYRWLREHACNEWYMDQTADLLADSRRLDKTIDAALAAKEA